MGDPIKKAESKFTYKEYSTWPDDERWELLGGIAYNMSPAPNANHQRISSILHNEIYNFLKGKKCVSFAAPFDVYFPENPNEDFYSIDTIVQPDISVICDPSKIIEKGCLGAPDLIIEILSPSTSKKDQNEKFLLYEKSGVREYWIVDPGNKFIQVFHIQKNDKYDYGNLTPPADWRDENTIVKSKVLLDFTIDVKNIFEE